MLQQLTRRILEREHLDEAEAERALELMLSDATSDVAIGSFLSALALKGETSQEIAGFARVMRRHVVSITCRHPKAVDTAGTGGGLDTFNISTTAAFVIAGAGVPVAKHGNRAITSRCGSADLLTELGVNINRSSQVAERSLNEFGIAFMFAPLFHPSMKRVAEIRRELGHRTVFNLLGPLTNPAAAPFQLVGVYSPSLTQKVAEALSHLECRRAWVVHSQDGLDELSTGAATRVSEIGPDGIRTFEFDSSELGLSQPDWGMLRGGPPGYNAEITRSILSGKTDGAARDVVVLNAAAALHLALDLDFPTAVQKARESIDSGAAWEKLNRLIEAYR